MSWQKALDAELNKHARRTAAFVKGFVRNSRIDKEHLAVLYIVFFIVYNRADPATSAGKELYFIMLMKIG
jgi:hypothetical protein